MGKKCFKIRALYTPSLWFLATNFLTKVAQIFGGFFGYFEQLLEKIGLLFITTSGNTVNTTTIF